MPLFELHIPILNDIKEKGLVPTIKDTTDDVVERITSGQQLGRRCLPNISFRMVIDIFLWL